MQVRLELYLADLDRDPFANIICNVAPRVGETITLLDGEAEGNRSGSYRVLAVDHMLDERRIETTQHVCLTVIRHTHQPRG
jgi:hypothetical protein